MTKAVGPEVSRRAIPRASRALAKLAWVADPLVFGPLYLLSLTLFALLVDTNDVSLGAHSSEIMGLITGAYRGEIRRMGIAIVAVAIGSGALVGGVAHALVTFRRWVRPSLPKNHLLGAIVVIATHAVVLSAALIREPQLYAPVFYARGGALRTVQVLLTDSLGRGGLFLLASIALFYFVFGTTSGGRPTFAELRRRATFSTRMISAVLLMAAFASFKWIGSSRRPLVPEARAQADAGRNSGTPRPAASDDAPNIILLGADSFRWDHLSADVTPKLSVLADRGVRFERAYVSLPRTFPSWMTMLTGRLPQEHGIRDMFSRWEQRRKDFDALPTHFRNAGYQTSVVSDYAGDIFGRADFGFEDNRTPTFNFRELVRQRALERATPVLPFLTTGVGRAVFPVLREFNQAADPFLLADDARAAVRAAGSKPLFLTLFFSTAHFPYAAPYPYYKKFTDPSYRGRFKYHRPVGLGTDRSIDDEDIAQIRALYRGALHSIDAAAAPLVEELLRSRRRTIVVIIADHGETLYEGHHGQGHGNHLFGDEAVHIPMVVIDSAKNGGTRVLDVVRDIDLAPTLLEIAGLPKNSASGESLVPFLAGKSLPGRLAYAETGLWFTEEIDGLDASLRMPYPPIERLTEIDLQHGDEVVLRSGVEAFTTLAKHRMIRDDRYKLIHVPTRLGPKLFLFDTVADPLEEHDISSQRPEIVERLRARLRALVLRDSETTEEHGLFVPRATRVDDAAPHLRLDGN